MPVSDNAYMMRLASAGNLDANEQTENGAKVGASPYQPIKARIYVPQAAGTSPTLDIKFQESDDDSSYSDIVGATVPQITAAGYYEIVMPRWTKLYVRHYATVGGTTPNFGAVTIGFTPGQIVTS